MTPAGPVAQSATFVACAWGQRFRLVSEPADRPPRGTVVFVHAFAEEMNKSRRMAARMARGLAGHGWRVVQPDLRGCGDSSGEFAEASWSDWVGDVATEVSQAAPAQPVWLWCLRAGALLAPGALALRPDTNLLLWQPVLSGAQHLQQFLRLHAGARIVGSGRSNIAASPAQTLRSGVSVELGGYELGPGLAQDLEQASFDLPVGFGGRSVWFELSTDEIPTASPQSTRLAERLTGRGLAVGPEVLRGPPFWLTQEVEECEALLERSITSVCVEPHG